MVYAMSELKRNNKPDDRLMELLVETREQQMGTGTTGGFAIPPAFRDELLLAVAQSGIIRPRATVIPSGYPPDAQMSIPALDQTSGANMYAGVTLVHTGEGVTMTETTAKLREVTYEPKEISGYIVLTNKLLNNWQAAGQVIGNLLRSAMTAQEDYDFLRGSGIKLALGIINSPASIVYARAGAGTIGFADVYGMLARAKMGGNLIWIASQTVIPALAAMVDAGSHAVWTGSQGVGNAAQAMPSTLFGYPLYFSDRMPSLGSKGDLMLIDPSYYVIKDGSGPFLSWSEHVWWTSNKTGVKIVWNVDGKAWLTEPLQLEGDSTKTISPFVILT
jgi:HK97 family phage major capsid protein